MSEEVAWSDANLREIARLRTALTNAQRLASDWQKTADQQRAQLDAAQAERAALRRWLGLAVRAWRGERQRVAEQDAQIERLAALAVERED